MMSSLSYYGILTGLLQLMAPRCGKHWLIESWSAAFFWLAPQGVWLPGLAPQGVWLPGLAPQGVWLPGLAPQGVWLPGQLMISSWY